VGTVTVCKACSKSLGPGEDEYCQSCREKLESVHSMSAEASPRAGLPCAACSAPGEAVAPTLLLASDDS